MLHGFLAQASSIWDLLAQPALTPKRMLSVSGPFQGLSVLQVKLNCTKITRWSLPIQAYNQRPR